jgi:hypothetical protein
MSECSGAQCPFRREAGRKGSEDRRAPLASLPLLRSLWGITSILVFADRHHEIREKFAIGATLTLSYRFVQGDASDVAGAHLKVQSVPGQCGYLGRGGFSYCSLLILTGMSILGVTLVMAASSRQTGWVKFGVYSKDSHLISVTTI